MDLDKLYNDTESYIQNLRSKYLAVHIATQTSGPDDYNNDVKSYCVLSHAALEEFVETVAINVMNQAIEDFTYNHIVSEPIIALMHFKNNGDSYLSKSENDSKIEIVSTYEYIRRTLIDVNSKFSNEVFNNHGVSLKYIKQLLMPVGVDIPNNPKWLGSLEQLARARGAYAHKFLEKGTVKKSIAPEDARNFVGDCLELCKEIKDNAKKKFNPSLISRMSISSKEYLWHQRIISNPVYKNVLKILAKF